MPHASNPVSSGTPSTTGGPIHVITLPHCLRVLTALVLAAAFGPADAQTMAPGTASGIYGSLSWTASSNLTGTFSTLSGGPISNGGNQIYWPSYPRDGGVVFISSDRRGCSGSLLSDRRSILTAAHCVSTGAGSADPLSTTVYFQPAGGLSPGTRIQTNAVPARGVVTRDVSQYFVNPGYTGDIFDENDIAVLRLSTVAPDWARSYDLFEPEDLQGRTFRMSGYGLLGDGATGSKAFLARLRTGFNRYDIRLGDPAFNGAWSDILGVPLSQIDEMWMADFDNGLLEYDAACLMAASLSGSLEFDPGSKYCNTGLGALEVSTAPGDSGAPGFVDDMIAGIHSFGFSSSSYDVNSVPDSSFGEFGGFVPTHVHAAFIRSAMVPAPDSIVMLGVALLSLTRIHRRRSVRP